MYVHREIKSLVDWVKCHKTVIGITLWSMLLWSWLVFVNVSKISGSVVIGLSVAIGAFIIIAGISAWCMLRVVQYFNAEYREQESLSFWFLAKVFFVWSGMELFTSWIVAVIWMGEGGSWDTVLPFHSLTPLLMYTPFGYLTRFFGYHGTSALFVVLFCVLCLPKLQKYRVKVVLIIVTLGLLSFGIFYQPNGTTINAVIVAEDFGENSQQIVTDADLVITPEYGLDGIESSGTKERVASLSDGNSVSVVGSRQEKQEDGVRNILTFATTDHGFVREYVKSRLIPAGEYLPFTLRTTLRTLGATEVLDSFDRVRTIKKGDAMAMPYTFSKLLVVGAEACASIISPEDYRKLTMQGATVLANSASLSIFKSGIFDVQYQGMAKFMATANARPLLQSTNAGVAFGLTHNGKVIRKIYPHSSTEVTITTNTKRTPYSYMGEWVAIVGVILIAGRLIYQIKSILLSRIRK